MSIQLPEYPITTLPSGGVAYPEDWEITIQPYKFGQIGALPNTSLAQKRFYSLILSGVNCNFSKDLFVLEDVLFLGVARKLISSVTDRVTLKSVCPACYTNVETVKPIKEMVQFKPGRIKDRSKYPVRVEFSAYTGWYRFLTIDEYINLLQNDKATSSTQLATQTVKLIKKPDIANGETDETIIHSTESPTSQQELVGIYNSFIGLDADILTEVLSLFSVEGIEPVEVICSNPECKTKFKHDLTSDGLASVLSPFRTDETRTVENSIIL